MRHLMVARLVLFALCATWAGPAAAAGPKKLKQPRTFPLTISAPGSYILESNITVPDHNTTAISINADNVTLDLNGFAILGPTVCTGTPVTMCAPSNVTTSGINANGRFNVTVRNGTVRGTGGTGISGAGVRVEGMHVTGNGGKGISIVFGSIVDNFVESNRDEGINGADLVTGNVVLFNGGIGVSGSKAVMGNTVRNNGGVGLSLPANAGYAHNVVHENNGGDANPQVTGGVDMGGNVCGTDTSCP